MKRLIIAALTLMAAAGAARAATLTNETPIGIVGGAFLVRPSTSAWTKVYASTAALPSGYKQAGLICNNPSTNTGSIKCVVADASTPSVSTTTYSVEFQPGENPFRPLSAGLFLWCVSGAASPEPFITQTVRQEP